MKKHKVGDSIDWMRDIHRFEVIDESGRVYVKQNCKVGQSIQDKGTTLKIFVENEKNLKIKKEKRIN